MANKVLFKPLVAVFIILSVFLMASAGWGATYYVDTNNINASDSNSGTLSQPWKTIKKAVSTVKAGDTTYIRGGEYPTVFGGWSFSNSGTSSMPITLVNYPGEQVIIKMAQTTLDYRAFRCWSAPTDPQSWQTPKADFVRIIGQDVTPRLLSNGVESKKGIIIQGVLGEQAAGILAAGCNNWEVAGIDFVEVAYGIFTQKRNFQTIQNNSADYWYVHDNRVYNYYRESGMQFNGNHNRLENNEIYKVSNDLSTPYGCQLLNFLGSNNTIKGNTLSRKGSTAGCGGILFEWDLADANTVEQNRILDVPWGIDIAGGDNNIIRNNLIYATGTQVPPKWGIKIESYDNRTAWPCNEPADILPANDPAAPDYQYYYNPRNCHSYGNQVYNNTIHGFVEGIDFQQIVGENTIIRNNVFSGWTRGSVCYYNASNGTCYPLPAGLTADHNADQGDFGFANIMNFDFHLTSNSPLIDKGYNLGALVSNDFEGNMRPQGAGYDIGAYEFVPSSPLPAPKNLIRLR